jgi:hypothetical protein
LLLEERPACLPDFLLGCMPDCLPAGPSAGKIQPWILLSFLETLEVLLSPPALSQLFADAMAASQADWATLTSVLLHIVLPRLALGLAQGLGSHISGGVATHQQPLLGVTETGLLTRLPVVLTSPGLAAFLGDCLCLPGGAQHLQLAAQILRALPSSRPAVVDAGS